MKKPKDPHENYRIAALKPEIIDKRRRKCRDYGKILVFMMNKPSEGTKSRKLLESLRKHVGKPYQEVMEHVPRDKINLFHGLRASGYISFQDTPTAPCPQPSPEPT